MNLGKRRDNNTAPPKTRRKQRSGGPQACAHAGALGLAAGLKRRLLERHVAVVLPRLVAAQRKHAVHRQPEDAQRQRRQRRGLRQNLARRKGTVRASDGGWVRASRRGQQH